eukprot:m51a1_g10787 hypothetical protein (113) ;mRNA; r:86172-86823
MKKSTLDNKKIKATSELNVAVIKSKGVLFSKFFESENNCKKLIQDSYKIYSQVKGLIYGLDTKDKELHSFSKMQLRVLKNTVHSGWLSDYVNCPTSDFKLEMGSVTAAIEES